MAGSRTPGCASSALLVSWRVSWLVAAALSASGPAWAQLQIESVAPPRPPHDAEVAAEAAPSLPGAAPRAALPDVLFAGTVNRVVILGMRDGTQPSGRLLSFDAQLVVLMAVPSGELMMLPRGDIVRVRVAPTGTSDCAAAADGAGGAPAARTARAPERRRVFGLQLGIAPALMVDLLVGRFYAFGNASLLFPLLTYTPATTFGFGGGGESHYFGFMLGMGTSLRLSDATRWRFDLVALGMVTNWSADDRTFGAVGVGLGGHYTFANGFVIAFKLPVLGAAFGPFGSMGESVGHFFTATLSSLPFISLGYRF